MFFITKLKQAFFNNLLNTSESKKLDINDFAKLCRDAIMVGGAAIFTFLAENLSSIDFGAKISDLLPILTSAQWNMIIVPIVAGALNTAIKFFKNNN